MQCFDRDAPLPEERLSLMFDIRTPSQKVTIDEMPAGMQVCNCNGVTKAAIAACVSSGRRSTKAVMDTTRAGKGCGSGKSLVREPVRWLRGGEVLSGWSVSPYRARRLSKTQRTRMASRVSSNAITASSAKRIRVHLTLRRSLMVANVAVDRKRAHAVLAHVAERHRGNRFAGHGLLTDRFAPYGAGPGARTASCC